MQRVELLSTIAFLEAMRDGALSGLGLHQSDPYWNMTIYVMKRHLEGKAVTTSGLAAASLVPYATAMRRIEEMINGGLLLKRVRTASGRAFSIHPTEEMLKRFERSMERVKRTVAQVSFSNEGEDFFFGGSYLGEQTVPPPSAMVPPIGKIGPIRILMQDDPTFRVLVRFRRELEEWLGGKIEFVVRSIDAVRVETLANNQRDRSHYDIVAIDLPWIGEYIASDVLLPLSAFIDEHTFDLSDFHATALTAASRGRANFALPIQTIPELLFWRTDIFGRLGLNEPQTTGDVIRSAQAVSRGGDGHSGIVWRAKRGLPVAQSFMQFLGAFGQAPIELPWVNDDFEMPSAADDLVPNLQTSAALETAEFMMELLSVSPRKVLEWDSEDVMACYAQGKAAMAYGWSCRASRFELDLSSPARAKTAYAEHPSSSRDIPSVSPLGGYLMGIPSNVDPTRQAVAWRTLAWLCSAEAMKFYVQNGSFASPRYSVGSDPEVIRNCRVIAVVDDIAQQGRIKLWPRPPVPGISDLMEILGEELHDMLMRRHPPAVALARAQNRASSPRSKNYQIE